MKGFYCLLILLVAGPYVKAQKAKAFNTKLDGPFTITKTFRVDGFCDMCKHSIEGALNKSAAIYFADWDAGSKMLFVKFNKTKISIRQIEEIVAGTGHNTPDVKADMAKAVADCCNYEKKST